MVKTVVFGLICMAAVCATSPAAALHQVPDNPRAPQGIEAYMPQYDWPWIHQKWNNSKDTELLPLRIQAYKMLEEFDPHEADYEKAKAESKADPDNRLKLAKWGWYSAIYHSRVPSGAEDRELMLTFGKSTGEVTLEFARMRMIAAGFSGFFGKSLLELARRIAAEDPKDYEIRLWLGMRSGTDTPEQRARTEKYALEMLEIDPKCPTAYRIYTSIEGRAALTKAPHPYIFERAEKCRYWGEQYIQREHRKGSEPAVNACKSLIQIMTNIATKERAALAAEKAAGKK